MAQTLSSSIPLSGQEMPLDREPIGGPSIRELPRLKADIDDLFREQFGKGDISAIDIADQLTCSYRSLLANATELSGLGAKLREDGFALVALGGFARGQSGIHSDWDAALIHPNRDAQLTHPAFTEFIDLMKYGIEIKFALRSPAAIAEILSEKNHHGIMSLTALLTIKVLGGGRDEIAEFEHSRDTLIQKDFPRILRMLSHSINERQHNQGTLFKLAEFNLKEARGGLRDLDCIAWIDQMARIVGFDPLLSDHEQSVVDSSREVLLRAKHTLHFSHRGDKYTNVNQWNNGRRSQLLEIFRRGMGDLLPPRIVYEMIYSASQQTATILNRMIERCEKHLQSNSARTSSSPEAHNTPLEITDSNQLGSLIRQGTRCIPQLRALFESGRLTQILPEFGRAEFFVDNAGFHRFPLGEHHVRAVEEISRLLGSLKVGALAEYGISSPSDTAPLIVATLLHDVAKPDEGLFLRDHPEHGAKIAHSVALRLGLSIEQADKTSRLDRDHMLIADIADRSELALDPANAILRIRDIDHLQELLLLTLADKKESNPFAWTASRFDQLLGAYQQLKIALSDPLECRVNLCNAVQELLAKQDGFIARDDIDSFVSEIPPEALGFYSPLILAEKIRLLTEVKARQESSEAPFRAKLILPDPSDSRLQLFFVCADSDGLLARVSTFLSQRNMSLRSALVDTRDGLACDYISIQSPNKVQLYQDDLDRFISTLRRAVISPIQTPLPSLLQPRGADRWRSEGLTQNFTVGVTHSLRVPYLSLTIVDPHGREVFPIIAPSLERYNLSVVNAQIGCGNRGVRHYFDLLPKLGQTPNLSALSREIEDAYHPSSDRLTP